MHWLKKHQHVHFVFLVFQMVLDDSAQIRKTLQGFSSVLQEMSQVCDVTTLQEKLLEADQQVAHVQDSFAAPLSHLGHAADVRLSSFDLADVKVSLHREICVSHPSTLCSRLISKWSNILIHLLLSRRWKPLRLKSGVWRMMWLRSRSYCLLRRLYPAPKKKASR